MRHRIGELELADIFLVDPVERRIALRVIGAMVHEPVLRLPVGVDEPLRRHVPRHRRAGRQRRGARQQQFADRAITPPHGSPPVLL